ncbi:TrbC/VirB2 family protein [Halorubrum sp. AD140]|uniref:TrbC/VirB2 family protein n=1 Tax=Halorubrum sp. AD140 TaxID=3050073 RepID=UPI002ACC82D5|nr:TrbC/VirB2 family protein [Halorubrum sp. AD140]MDZ5813093.1 TrbC/VirB2 family protein [Halorubrum sp. AD140]
MDILSTIASVPPFISGLREVLNTFTDWLLYLVPAIIILVLVVGGITLAKADDSHETKAIKDRMGRSIIGVALAGSAVWIGNWMWGIFESSAPGNQSVEVLTNVATILL